MFLQKKLEKYLEFAFFYTFAYQNNNYEIIQAIHYINNRPANFFL